MSRKMKFSIGDRIIQFKFNDFDDEVDVDKILKIDYGNLLAELLVFPVVVNRLGILAAEMDNEVSQAKLDFSVFKAKESERLRISLQDENGKRPTIAEVEDALIQQAKYRIKYKQFNKVIKEKEYIYSIYMSAKDKSKKLDRLSTSLRGEDLDEATIQKQMNSIYFKLQKGKITDE